MEGEWLPAGWEIATLSDLGQWTSGGTPSKKRPDYHNGEIPWVLTGDLTDGPVRNVPNGITETGLRNSSAKIFPPGTLLMAMYGATIGKLGVLQREAATNQACAALLPSQANRDALPYVYFYLRSKREQFKQAGKGGAQPNISQGVIKETFIPVPPLPEQQRIVEKIETLFAELDKGEEALREVQKLLSRYRQSVLKAAVTGTLTAMGPTEWVPVVLGDLLADIRYGTAKKCRPDVAGTPVLRIPNVVGGDIDLADLKFTQLTEKELEKLSLREGDVLIVRSNGSANLVGRGAIVTAEAVGMAYAGYLIRLRLNRKRILPGFLHIVLNSPAVRARIERQAKSTSGVHNLNSAETKAIAFDLPHIDTQAKIVEAVEEAIARIEQGEAWCETELKRSAALRQSILKDGFSGKLVPQDPSDEPAEKLLDRIRAARAEKPKAKRKKAAA